MSANAESQYVGRCWPTEKRRPNESIADWCRRIDSYVNPSAPPRSEEGSAA